MAWERGAALPPVALLRVGEVHHVFDGHHRVSVARAHGVPFIDAEVVELRTPGERPRGGGPGGGAARHAAAAS